MKIENKTSAIALFLVLTVAVTLVALPVAYAHTPPWDIPTYCFVSVTNSVIGVNQQAVIVFWTASYPPTANGAYGDRWTFTVEVTKPDGSKENLGPFTSDPVGSGWTGYTPTQVGTYKIVAKFAQHKITGQPQPAGGYFMGGDVYINDTFLASDSDPIYVTVQAEPIQPWPEAPLPTQFWTRPFNEANRNWACLAANWLAGSAQYYPAGAGGGATASYSYGLGLESAHVMWATPMWAGGIMDARFGDTGYSTSDYEGLSFFPPIILNGKIFYNVQSLPKYGWWCLDLYTGEELFFHNGTGAISAASGSSSGGIPGDALAFGQIYNYESPNQHGGKPYLWSTGTTGGFFEMGGATWKMFDAYTGNYMCSIKNVPSWATGPSFFGGGGVAVYGIDGSITAYNVVGTQPSGPFGPTTAPFYLQCWNTSRAIWWKATWGTTFAEYWLWRPGLNVTYDGNNGYSLNVSLPWTSSAGSVMVAREGQYIIGGTSGKNNGTYSSPGTLWALSLKPGSEGTLLWNITYTPPQAVPDRAVTGIFGGGGMSGPTVYPEDGVFVFSQSMTRQYWGYSLATGQQIWGPTASEPQMKYYGMTQTVYQGKLLSYTGLSSGDLYAYDIKTGKLLWIYNASQVGFESPYGNYPISLACIADGKIYMYSTEHSPTQPLWRGSYLRCVNASNGAELWKILHWGPAVAADGFLVGLNFYDNQIYCYGKGPSATTVSAGPKVSVQGTSVVIEGTVTDQCAGAKKLAEQRGYASGIPAVADESMEAWMEYLYAGEAMPANAAGVEVTLDTLDPNGNFVHIGTATSDTSGTFSYMWKPDVPGKYTIIASFVGTKGYYGSYAETAVGVDQAPPATAPPEYPQPIDNTMTILYATIAIIITIVIVGILMLRKK